MFIVDLKRAILSKRMVFSIIIGLVIILLGTMEPLKAAYELYTDTNAEISIEDTNMLIANCLNKVTLWSFGNYYFMALIPLICCIPFSIEYLKDKKSGFNKYQIIRCNYKEYIFSKISVTFLSGFISVLSIYVIFAIMLFLVDSGDVNRSLYFDNTFLSDLGRNHFNLFMMVHMLMCAFMGGVYSLIGLAVSTMTSKTIIPLATPLIIYLFGNYFLENKLGYQFSLCLPTSFYSYEEVKGIYILIQVIVLIAISLGIILKNTYLSEDHE